MQILLVRLSSLGDVILVSSVFNQLKSQGVVFDLLTLEKYSEVYIHDNRVRNLWSLKNTSFRNILKLSEKINTVRYDFIFDLHCTLKTHLLSTFLKAKVIRYNKHAVRRRAMLFLKKLKRVPLDVPRMYAEAFRKVGINISEPRPEVFVPEWVTEKISGFGIPVPFVVICPGAKWDSKRYPVERFADVARKVERAGFNIVLLGDTKDCVLCSYIETCLKMPFNLCGKLSFIESIGVMRFASLVISNDSSPVHMARSVGTKIISIFGPTHPAFGFAPGKDEGVALTLDVNCSPCSLHGNTSCRNRKCLDIPSDFVVDKAMELLREI